MLNYRQELSTCPYSESETGYSSVFEAFNVTRSFDILLLTPYISCPILTQTKMISL